jgi:serine/threonine kinase 16
LDEKVDIWSLGCMLYALAYGHSPFEGPQEQQGGSIMLAALSGKFKFPTNDQVYSQHLRDLITSMLIVDPQKRPDIHQVCKNISFFPLKVTSLI